MVDPLSLTVDACLEAVADAGLTLDDIDGLSTYPGMAGMGMSEGGVTAVEDGLRLHPTWINGGGDLPGPGGAVIAAVLAVASGLCRHVLCFRTVWESTFATLRLASGGGARVGLDAVARTVRRDVGGALDRHDRQPVLHSLWREPRDARLHRAQRTSERARNPAAIYREPMSMDDYLSARPITSPFGLYDCDVPCDGSIAVVVSSAEVAGDLPKPAIRIAAAGTQILERVSWDQGTVTHEPQVLGQSAHLWTRTDLRPDDVDFALVYDGFTFNAVSWLEALGFCGLGEATDWLDGGKRIALDGDLPVNPHGGQLSEGRTHGFGFLYEAVTQLRHEADGRQVANATTAVVTSGGGTPSSVLLLQTRRCVMARSTKGRTKGSVRRKGEPTAPKARTKPVDGRRAKTERRATSGRTDLAPAKALVPRARLVDAAKQVFEESGFLDARISDIAERAGLSHGSYYHYFDSKEEVFLEVAEAEGARFSRDSLMARGLVGASTDDAGTDDDVAERLHASVRRYLEMYRAEARIMGVIEQVSRYHEPRHARSGPLSSSSTSARSRTRSVSSSGVAGSTTVSIRRSRLRR